MNAASLFTEAEAPLAIPTPRLIACAERELKKRLQVYPRLVAAGKMTQAFADEELACQRAIIERLRLTSPAAERREHF